jgi:hypothetical protein
VGGGQILVKECEASLATQSNEAKEYELQKH